MFIDSSDNRINITVSELVYISCRKKEPFSKFDKLLIDSSDFAVSVAKREDEVHGRIYYSDINLVCSYKINEDIVELNSKTCISSENDSFAIDVVKSVRYPIKYIGDEVFDYWLTEGKINAFIFAKKRKLSSVTVRVSLFNTETLFRKNKIVTYTVDELESFFKFTLSEFYKYFSLILHHVKRRNASESGLTFPFRQLRDGQKEIAKEIFSAIKNKQNVIINAPTGIGKTVSTLYPALKAQGKGLCNKIFYLTAKNSGNDTALKTLSLFLEKGCELYVLVMSAKSKICNKVCSPKVCSFEKGHSERINSAILDIVKTHSVFTKEIILEFSNKYQVCPFMLEMELSLFADVVVCDYNYVFNSEISSKMSSAFSGNDVFLIDESHNLIDRVRNINCEKIDVNKLLQLVEKLEPSVKLKKSIKNFNKFLQNEIEDSDFSCEIFSSQSIDKLEREVNILLSDFQDYFEDQTNLDSSDFLTLRSLSVSLKRFVEFLTFRKDEFLVFYNDDKCPEIFLVDTSKLLRELSKKLGSFVMFSATLFPEEYYKYMLGCTKKDVYFSLSSPFNFENLLVLAYPLSTKFSDRVTTIEEVVSAIFTAGAQKKGNYISFFPSYEYMKLALDTFVKMFPNENVIYQKAGMEDKDKDDFLNSFETFPENTMYAFAVLGGVFSEGIDLVGDKLSGATVVGLGSLPPTRKSSIISQYFSDLFFDGEKFAYHYPGLNKVFQAGGRVIRSENDRGFLMIIDDRFLGEDNIELLPDNWKNIKKVKSNNEVADFLKAFW